MSTKFEITIRDDHDAIWEEAMRHVALYGGTLSDLVTRALDELLDRERNEGSTPLELNITGTIVRYVADDGTVVLGSTAEDSAKRPYVLKQILLLRDVQVFVEELTRRLSGQ